MSLTRPIRTALATAFLLAPGAAAAAPASTLYDLQTVVTATSGERLLSVAADVDGLVYIADGGDTVYVYDTDVGSIDTFISGVASDTDVVRLADDGTIVVSGQPATGWDADGNQLWSADCGYGNPQGMDVSSDGTVYMANGTEVCEIDVSGASASAATFGSYAEVSQGVAFDADTGELAVSFGRFADDTSWSLEVISSADGSSLDTLTGPGEVYTNTGLADDSRGVLMADRASQSLVLIGDDGTITDLATGFARIADVSIGLDGHIYVSDTGDGVVYVLDRDTDDDGVDELDDDCEGTEDGAATGEDGCSGEQVVVEECGEADDWKNHGQYLVCVGESASDAVDAGLLTPKEAAALKSAAARSDTGKKK